MYDI